tara:strand:- start:1548 stop:2744 length:1197 start_codon:yes stop_codon:yes gene_type:complete
MSKKIILAYPWDNPIVLSREGSKEKLINEIQSGHLFDVLKYFTKIEGFKTEVVRFYNPAKKAKLWEPFKLNTIDGVNVKLIPTGGKFSLSKVFNYNFLAYISKQKKDNDIFLMLNGLHFWLTYQIGLFGSSVPIICSQAGTKPPKFRNSNLILNKIKTVIEKLSFPGIDKFYAVSPYSVEYLSNLLKKDISFEYLYAKNSDSYYYIEKKLARKKLKMSFYKKIVIFVGRVSYGKGADNFIKLKKMMKNDNFEFLMIGPISNKKLYNDAISAGIQVIGRIDSNQMLYYYNSADVFVECEFNDEIIKFGGIGSAVVESLMCQRPVVGKALRLLPFRDLDQFIPEDISAASHLIRKLINEPEVFNKERALNLVKENYDVKHIYPKLKSHISNLSLKYYNQK